MFDEAGKAQLKDPTPYTQALQKHKEAKPFPGQSGIIPTVKVKAYPGEERVREAVKKQNVVKL